MNVIGYYFTNYEQYILIGLLCFVLFLFFIVLIQGSQINKLKKNSGLLNNNSLDQNDGYVTNSINQLESLKNGLAQLENQYLIINKKLNNTFQKVGVVKYNAVQGLGGNISFVIAFLNDNLNGILINSIHSRDGTYTYIKEVENGKTMTQLSNEEKEALRKAINKNDYY